MRYAAKVLEKDFIVELEDRGTVVDLTVDDKPAKFEFTSGKNKHRILLIIDSMSYDVEVNRSNGKFSVFIYGREFEVYAEDERLAKLREVAGLDMGGDSQKELTAPMPGLVTGILKNVGDTVAKGEGLIMMEAMKMENELKAVADAEIAEIFVEPGQSVDKGACLIKFV